MHALDCPDDWSCICANGRSPIPGTFGMLTTMYDAMAFCNSKEDIEESKHGSRGMLCLFRKYMRLMYLSNHSSSSTYVPVLSAFNGLAIYKMKDVHGLLYKEGYSCEHISLHEQLVTSQKKIFIDRNLVLFAGHQGPRKLADFFKC